jgi:outer membrane protein with beta-barrel domain
VPSSIDMIRPRNSSPAAVDCELGYVAGGNDFDGVIQGVGVDVESSAISVDLNAHYLFPQSTKEALTPYLLVGLGILRARASTTVFGTSTSVSDTEAGLNIGAGARWQGGVNWGVRPELKVFVADNSSVRFSVGLYYQFGRQIRVPCVNTRAIKNSPQCCLLATASRRSNVTVVTSPATVRI